jgi:hypothetical protein
MAPSRPPKPGGFAILVGEFVGVAGVNLSLAFFNQWLERIDVGPHSSVLIIDDQMALLARRPALPNDQIGKIVDEPSSGT